jgi:hypothetical protein
MPGPATTRAGQCGTRRAGRVPGTGRFSFAAASAQVLARQYGPGAADWYTRLAEIIPEPFLATVSAAALGPDAAEIMYVCQRQPWARRSRYGQRSKAPPGRGKPAGGDPFLRTGHPAAETLALLVLKSRTWSAIRPGPGTRLVL